jgi:hypothetical protein
MTPFEFATVLLVYLIFFGTGVILVRFALESVVVLDGLVWQGFSGLTRLKRRLLG